MKVDAFKVWAEQLALWTPPKPDDRATGSHGDSWANIARWYAKVNRQARANADALIRRVSDITDARSIVVDVGAGAGRIAIPLAASVSKVIAVESSPAMRSILQQRVSAASIKNVEIVAGRWPEVDVPDAGVVFCANVLYDVGNLAPFLARMDRVATQRCFAELSPRHPLDAYRQLWIELLGWTPPSGPTYLDAVKCLHQLQVDPEIEIVRPTSGIAFEDEDQAAAFYRDRLGLIEGSEADVSLRCRVASLCTRSDNGCTIPQWQYDSTIILSWSPGPMQSG